MLFRSTKVTSTTSLKKVMIDEDTPLSDIAAVVAGATFTLAMDSQNRIWIWGLYNGTNHPYATLVVDYGDDMGAGEVQNLEEKIYQISARADTFALLDVEGKAFINQTVGTDDELYQVRNGEAKYYNGNEAEDVLTGIISVASGTDHVMFIVEDGSVYGYGEDDHSQLGDKDGDNDETTGEREQESTKALPVRAGTHLPAIRTEKTSYILKNNADANETLNLGGEAKTITTPSSFSLTSYPTEVSTVSKNIALVYTLQGGVYDNATDTYSRSEERRVGKECT